MGQHRAATRCHCHQHPINCPCHRAGLAGDLLWPGHACRCDVYSFRPKFHSWFLLLYQYQERLDSGCASRCPGVRLKPEACRLFARAQAGLYWLCSERENKCTLDWPGHRSQDSAGCLLSSPPLRPTRAGYPSRPASRRVLEACDDHMAKSQKERETGPC